MSPPTCNRFMWNMGLSMRKQSCSSKKLCRFALSHEEQGCRGAERNSGTDGGTRQGRQSVQAAW